MSPEKILYKQISSRQFSLSKISNIGCNHILGCTTNYWMQKHPMVGRSNLYKAIANSRNHWKVVSHSKPVVQAINKYFNQTSNSYIILLLKSRTELLLLQVTQYYQDLMSNGFQRLRMVIRIVRMIIR